MAEVRYLWLILVLVAGPLWGQAYPSYPLGQYWIFPDARTLGLAGSGTVSNTYPGALVMNPAALGMSAVGLQLELSPMVRKLEERRSYPLYNRIDDITQQSIYALNLHWYGGIQGGLVWRPEWKFLPTMAIGRYREVDQNYRYLEEVRKNIFGDSLLAENRITIDGQLQRVSVGGAFRILPAVYVGFQVGILSGKLDKDSSITFFDRRPFAEPGVRITRELLGHPLVFSVGGIFLFNPHFRLGATVQLPYTVRWKYNRVHRYSETWISGEERFEYPLQATGGMEFRARQELQARLNVDVTYFWWSRTRSKVLSDTHVRDVRGLEDAVHIKAGIEHIFFNKVPFRVGIQFRTSPKNRRRSRTLLTAGTGFSGKYWHVDMAGGFSPLSYRFPDVFDDSLFGGFRVEGGLDTVEENFFFGLLTLRLFPGFLRK